MSEDYTNEELEEFKYLVEMGESCHQMDRIESRLEMPLFIKRHGKEKCDSMFEELTEQDAKGKRR